MFKNILIIGFGMIGSSIAQSAKKSNKAIKIYAFDKSPTIKQRLANAKLSKVTLLKFLSNINFRQEKCCNYGS